jgi:hypothetical protein
MMYYHQFRNFKEGGAMPAGKAFALLFKEIFSCRDDEALARKQRIERLRTAFKQTFPIPEDDRNGECFEQRQRLVDEFLRTYAVDLDIALRNAAKGIPGAQKAVVKCDNAFGEVYEAFSGVGFRMLTGYSDYLPKSKQDQSLLLCHR